MQGAQHVTAGVCSRMHHRAYLTHRAVRLQLSDPQRVGGRVLPEPHQPPGVRVHVRVRAAACV